MRLGRSEHIKPELQHIIVDFGGTGHGSGADAKRRLQKASVVCCTCIGAGSDVFGSRVYERVLIDEAAQVTDFDNFFAYSCSKCTLEMSMHSLL